MKPLRRDAMESRARIVSAARVVFAEHGCEVPLSEIAAVAGVGVATLSRHFDRAQLVQAVIEQRLLEHVNTADDALALAPEEALLSYVRGLCARGLVDRSLIRTFTLPLPDSQIAGRLRRQLRQRQLRLIKAGQDAGVLGRAWFPRIFFSFSWQCSAACRARLEMPRGNVRWQSFLPDCPMPPQIASCRDPLGWTTSFNLPTVHDRGDGPARSRNLDTKPCWLRPAPAVAPCEVVDAGEPLRNLH